MVAGLLVVLAGALVVAGFSHDDAPRASARPVEGTALWSARRLPQAVGDAAAVQATNSAIDRALNGANACVIVRDSTGLIAQRGAGSALTPASTEKVLTAAAALETMGPGFRFETRALAAAAPTGNGTVDRIVLEGNGDPVLATADFQNWRKGDPKHRDEVTTPLGALADSIVKSGVRNVPGGIVVDGTRYESVRYVPTWRDSYRLNGEVGPLGALTVNDGFEEYRGRPQGANDPAVLAGSELAALLTARGVTVGPVAAGRVGSEKTVVGSVASAPLSDIVASMIRGSDNYTAEMLTKELAVRNGVRPGTTAEGVKVTVTELGKAGVPTDGITMIDGSGLDRGNRVPCEAIDAVLVKTRTDPKLRAIDEGFAVAGKNGTLVDRFGGTDLVGRLRAKTGTLQGVTGLAGELDGARPLTFTLIANDSFDLTRGFALQQQVAQAVDDFAAAAETGRRAVPAPR